MITFQGAIQQAKDKDQKLSLLLGNGFSIDFDPQIFRQDELIKTAKKLKLFENEKLLSQILDTDKPGNFEVLMQLIRKYCLPEEIEEQKDILLKNIMQALSYNHPDSALAITDIQSDHCAKFLSNFQSIYTLNYDLLLYWVIMKAKLTNEFRDGFCNNVVPITGDFLTWYYHKNDCTTVRYLHGGLHLYIEPNNNRIAKHRYSNGKNLKEQIVEALNKKQYPISVSAETSQEKLKVIKQHHYLECALERLKGAEGSLFIHGFNFNPNDEHIIVAIAHSKIERLFIGLHPSNNQENLQNALKKIHDYRNPLNKKPLEVTYYGAETAVIWRRISNPIIKDEQYVIADETC